MANTKGSFGWVGSKARRSNALLHPARLIAIALAMSAVQPADAMVIHADYSDGSAATNFGANFVNFQNAFTAASLLITSRFTDAIDINIAVHGAAGTGILGQSSTPIFSTSYAVMRGAMIGDVTGPAGSDDRIATGAGGSIVASDPAPAAVGHNWWMTRAQQKAVNLRVNDLANDGTVTFGAGFSYDYDRVGQLATEFDLIGVMVHEITEIMGRVGISGGSVAGVPGYTLLDDFSYTAPGAKGLGGGSGNSFSIDNGTTLLKGFNGVAGGDTRDWASGTNDAFNAFSGPGVQNALSLVDLRVMDVIGYDLTQSALVPEPDMLGLLAIGLVGLGFGRRRKM